MFVGQTAVPSFVLLGPPTMSPFLFLGVCLLQSMFFGVGRIRRGAWSGGRESTWRSFHAQSLEASLVYRVHCALTDVVQRRIN